MTQAPEFALEGIIEHRGEERSNAVRRRAALVEPVALRTFTPTLAVIERSAGSYHWTPEGRMLADFSSGVLVANLGHNPSHWWRRVIEYLGMWDFKSGGEFFPAAPLTAYNAITELDTLRQRAVDRSLAKSAGRGPLRTSDVGCQRQRSDSKGAVDGARSPARFGHDPGDSSRLSRQKGIGWRRHRLRNGSRARPTRAVHRFPARRVRECRIAAAPARFGSLYRGPGGRRKEFGERIACLVTEPYLGGGGSYHPQKEYLKLLERFCRDNDIVFILDEVQANFGRTGSLFAFTEYGVEPDLVVLGKGLGNGVPVSAAVGRADLFAAMHYGEGSDTWSANPLSSAAVLATLDEFESRDVIGHARELSMVIEQGLSRLAELPCVANVRGEGVVWGVECAPVGRHSAEQVAIAAVEACYRGDAAGLAIHLLGPLAGKVLRVSPPLVMPLDEARMYFEAMHGIFAALAARLQAA